MTQDPSTETRTPAQIIAAALRAKNIIPDDPREPATFSKNTLTILNKRTYLAEFDDGQRETPSDMFWRVAENIKDNQILNNRPALWPSAEHYYNVMAALLFLPNSPTLMNAGRPLQQLSACFVLPVDDNLESIFETVKQTALIHQSGGGTGFDFSRLRPEGDPVKSTRGVASGPVSFMDNFDMATETVKQGGTRRGANMGILRIDHPDIMQFITRKADPRKLQNFNISVAITDEFMEALAEDLYVYDLHHPVTGDVCGNESIQDVWRAITESAWATGDPGLVFIDEINRKDPSPHLGRIECVNPCGEQPLRPYESCNLGSLNLARHVRYDDAQAQYVIDWELLNNTIQIAVHFLDGVIDANNYPLPAIADAAYNTRRIGLGVMGFADLCVILGQRYDSPEGFVLAQNVMEYIQRVTHDVSHAMAEEVGTYPAWIEISGNDWHQAMRHTAPVTIAPTGTISRIAGASSGIEPYFALAYESNVMDGTRLSEFNPYFEAVVDYIDLQAVDVLKRQVACTGTLDRTDLGEGREWVNLVFRTAGQITPADHIKMQAVFQEYTDNAVSKTINMPESATVEDVSRVYKTAWEAKCKGITVYRDGSKDYQVLTMGDGSVVDPSGMTLGERWDRMSEAMGDPVKEIAGVARQYNIDAKAALHLLEVAPELKYSLENGHLKAARRARQLTGDTTRVQTGHGALYVTVNTRAGCNEPFEVLASLSKPGTCEAANAEAICRLVSMSLRAGIAVTEVIDQLQGITCCPQWDCGVLGRSIPDSIANVLKEHVGIPVPVVNDPELTAQRPLQGGQSRCPMCRGPMAQVEGCETCMDSACGYSSCD